MQDNKTQIWLKRLAMISAWILLAGIVVLIFSGWGITQTGVIYRLTGGLIDRRVADTIHRDSNAPLAFFFLSHVFINISLMVTRKNPSLSRVVNALLILIGIGLMAGMIYMEFVRRGG